MSERRWLWITPEVREDLRTGALIYSMNLVRAVAASGQLVHVVGLGDTSPAWPGVVAHPVPGQLRGGLRSVPSPLPNLAYAAGVPAVRDAVGRLLEETWDVVVIDGLQAAWSIDLVRAATRSATVFVAHNHEASLRRHVADDTSWRSPRRPVLALDARKAARTERSAARLADLVTSITDADRRRFEVDAPESRHLTLVPGWSGPARRDPKPMSDRPRAVAMLGSFDWHVKQENLRRFVLAADPVLAEAGVRVRIGGRLPEPLLAELTAASRATEFVGWVDDAAGFFDTARIGVISEPLGGGFKLKALDYVFNSLPVATLRGGGTGLPLVAGTSMIEADTEVALARSIIEAIDDADGLEAIAATALGACEAEMTWPGRAQALIDAVEACIDGCDGKSVENTV